jgi:hypothetical protein
MASPAAPRALSTRQLGPSRGKGSLLGLDPGARAVQRVSPGWCRDLLRHSAKAAFQFSTVTGPRKSPARLSTLVPLAVVSGSGTSWARSAKAPGQDPPRCRVGSAAGAALSASFPGPPRAGAVPGPRTSSSLAYAGNGASRSSAPPGRSARRDTAAWPPHHPAGSPDDAPQAGRGSVPRHEPPAPEAPRTAAGWRPQASSTE